MDSDALLVRLFEIRKLSAKAQAAMSPAERKHYRAAVKAYAEKRKPAAAKYKSAEKRKLEQEQKAKASKPAAKPAAKKAEKPVEAPSVGDLLLKGKVNMGSLRAITNKIHPSYRGALHHHLAHNAHEHEAFNADPEEYVRGWFHTHKQTQAPKNPRTTISLPGRFGNMGGK